MRIALAGGMEVDLATSDELAKHYDKLTRAFRPGTLLGRRVQFSKTQSAAAPTYIYIDTGGPAQPYVWDCRALAFNFTPDPFASGAAISAFAFVGSKPPMDGNTQPEPYSDPVDIPATFPNAIYWDKGQEILQPGEHLILVFKGVAAGSIIVGKLQVTQITRDEAWFLGI